MVCPNCGETLPDGSKFCGNCGMSMASQTSEEKTPPLTPPSRDNSPEAGAQEDIIVGVKKRRNIKKTAALLAVAALVVCVAGLFAWRALSAGNSADALISLSGGKYYFIKGQKGKPIEFASLRANSRGSNDSSDLVSFSPDRRYAYYFTRVDDDSIGSLCRVEYKKLKPDSSKNENYTELIASNVSMTSLTFMDSGTVLYKNSDDTLYCFDGREAVQIARNVDRFVTEGSAIVYSTGNYADGYSLYATSAKGSDEKVKLASDIDALYLFKSTDVIVYAKEGDDGSTALYLTGLSKETVKLTSNASTILAYLGLDSLYFTEASPDKAIALYDFIADPDAADDIGLQEPDREDFRIVTYNYRAPSLDGLDESAYPELY
ncbi:MAG: zinc ribbon domain-containing protein, partial [Oscillibacter sp.]|nr:zinc ribbon domain-containing protein [Oscillibacter sp.]